MSVVATNTMRSAAIIVCLFVMVILNRLSSSSCDQLLKKKGELEHEIARLDDARLRESTRWEKMKTVENIEQALLRHGLAMKTPRGDQTVRLLPDGTPRPGQLALAKAKMRGGLEAVASVGSPAAAKPKATRAAVRTTSYKVPYRRKRSVR